METEDGETLTFLGSITVLQRPVKAKVTGSIPVLGASNLSRAVRHYVANVVAGVRIPEIAPWSIAQITEAGPKSSPTVQVKTLLDHRSFTTENASDEVHRSFAGSRKS